jgi:hypothetical protein
MIEGYRVAENIVSVYKTNKAYNLGGEHVKKADTRGKEKRIY